MAGATRTEEVSLANQFLADAKTLAGSPPEFGAKRQPRHQGRREGFWEAVWPIANSLGIVETGQVRVVVTPASELAPVV
jgi:hypothetical protein